MRVRTSSFEAMGHWKNGCWKMVDSASGEGVVGEWRESGARDGQLVGCICFNAVTGCTSKALDLPDDQHSNHSPVALNFGYWAKDWDCGHKPQKCVLSIVLSRLYLGDGVRNKPGEVVWAPNWDAFLMLSSTTESRLQNKNNNTKKAECIHEGNLNGSNTGWSTEDMLLDSISNVWGCRTEGHLLLATALKQESEIWRLVSSIPPHTQSECTHASHTSLNQDKRDLPFNKDMSLYCETTTLLLWSPCLSLKCSACVYVLCA